MPTWKYNEPRDAHVIAADIVGFSAGSADYRELLRQRESLLTAIENTTLFAANVDHGGVAGQFLGDEVRLALTKQAATPIDITGLLNELLDSLATSSGTQIRAAYLTGVVTLCRDSRLGCQYLSGETLFKAQRWLQSPNLGAGQIVSAERLPNWSSTTHEGDQVFVNTRSPLPKGAVKVAAPYPAAHVTDRTFIGLAAMMDGVSDHSQRAEATKMLVERVGQVVTTIGTPVTDSILASVSPGGLLLAVEDDTLNFVKVFLNALMETSEEDLIAAAVARGQCIPVSRKRWLSSNFESGAAIECVRLLSQLKAGELALSPSLVALAGRDRWFGQLSPRVVKAKGREFSAQVADYFHSTSRPSPVVDHKRTGDSALLPATSGRRVMLLGPSGAVGGDFLRAAQAATTALGVSWVGAKEGADAWPAKLAAESDFRGEVLAAAAVLAVVTEQSRNDPELLLRISLAHELGRLRAILVPRSIYELRSYGRYPCLVFGPDLSEALANATSLYRVHRQEWNDGDTSFLWTLFGLVISVVSPNSI